MARTRHHGTYRVTSFPRRLYYKTKRIITRPIRRRRAYDTTTTRPATTTAPRTTRRPKLFGGFARGHRTTQPRPTRRKGLHLFGFTIRKDRHHNNAY